MPVSLEMTYGTINLRKKSAKCYMFYSPKGGKEAKECYLSEAAKTRYRDKVVELGRPTYISSVVGIKQEIGGRMIRCKYTIESNEILKMFVHVREGYGKMPRVGSIFLLVSETAPLRTIKIPLLADNEVEMTEATVTGRFTIISGETANQLGVHVPKAFIASASIERANRLISENDILAEGVETTLEVKEIEGDDGKTVKVLKKKRRRSIG